jgi:ubiquinone/menaquinone biosynthesis C-methylase UbiE
VIELIDFVLAHLPQRPARVLEVGCGDGELARALAATGHDVTAIDPEAPTGTIFRAVRLEDFDDDSVFDAVVASRSFHHMPNLEANLDRVVRFLAEGGRFILDEFAWDRLDEPTAAWYERRRRVVPQVEAHRPSAAEWRSHHAGLHGAHRLLSASRERFDEREFAWVPYLWRYVDDPTTLAAEEAAIERGEINAIGFRFVGIPHRGEPLKPL